MRAARIWSKFAPGPKPSVRSAASLFHCTEPGLLSWWVGAGSCMSSEGPSAPARAQTVGRCCRARTLPKVTGRGAALPETAGCVSVGLGRQNMAGAMEPCATDTDLGAQAAACEACVAGCMREAAQAVFM